MEQQLSVPPPGHRFRMVPVRSTTSQTEKVTKATKKISVRTITTVTTARNRGEKIVNKNKKIIKTTTTSDGQVVLKKTPSEETKQLLKGSPSDGNQKPKEDLCKTSLKPFLQVAEVVENISDDEVKGEIRGCTTTLTKTHISPRKNRASDASLNLTSASQTGILSPSSLYADNSSMSEGSCSVSLVSDVCLKPDGRNEPVATQSDREINARCVKQDAAPQSLQPNAVSMSAVTLQNDFEGSSLDYRSIWSIGQLVGVERQQRKKICCYKDYLMC